MRCCRCKQSSSVPRAGLRTACALLAAAGVLGAAPAAQALVASCPDGSLVLAQRWEDVHCRGAVPVPPSAPSKLRVLDHRRSPEYQAHLRRHEAARERALEDQLEAGLPPVSAPPPPVAWEHGPSLGDAERRDLASFVRRSQERSEAIVARGPWGQMRLAHSRRFQKRLETWLAARRGSHARPAGPALVFELEPGAPRPGTPTPRFAQGGVTFEPRAADPSQLGWIGGNGDARLGYVVLPVGFELSRPIVVFWGDAVAAAWLRR